jgi:hypothetical protein
MFLEKIAPGTKLSVQMGAPLANLNVDVTGAVFDPPAFKV